MWHFIGRKLLSALCQLTTFVPVPARFAILSMGTEDEYSHPWKMSATPWNHPPGAKADRFIFLALFLNYIRHQKRPSHISGANMLTGLHVRKRPVIEIYGVRLRCVKSDTCLINSEMKCQISLCGGCVYVSHLTCAYTIQRGGGKNDLKRKKKGSHKLKAREGKWIGSMSVK